jgi:hypothetical protein
MQAVLCILDEIPGRQKHCLALALYDGMSHLPMAPSSNFSVRSAFALVPGI